MSFTRFCKRISVAFFIAVVAYLLISTTYIRFFNIALIITFSAGILSIIVYALGDIVESLRCISTMLVQQDIKNEHLEDDRI